MRGNVILVMIAYAFIVMINHDGFGPLAWYIFSVRGENTLLEIASRFLLVAGLGFLFFTFFMKHGQLTFAVKISGTMFLFFSWICSISLSELPIVTLISSLPFLYFSGRFLYKIAVRSRAIEMERKTKKDQNLS